MNDHIGQSLEDFLDELGIRAEVEALAARKRALLALVPPPNPEADALANAMLRASEPAAPGRRITRRKGRGGS